MKNKEKLNVMRVVAGIFYAIFAFYIIWVFKPYFTLSFTAVPMSVQAELMFAAGALVFAVWLFSGNFIPKNSMIKSTITATFAVIVYEIITYELQTKDIINAFLLSAAKTDISAKPIIQYILVVAKIVLIILGAFFVVSTKDSELKEAALAMQHEAEEMQESGVPQQDTAENGTNNIEE